MLPNPLLKELGLSDDDRVVILHADDVGMCQSSLAAYIDLLDFGLISSAALMVPSPWFPATATFCRNHLSEEIDMGVHLTFTSEWEGYRWGPISSCKSSNGMTDGFGYFHLTTEMVQVNGNPSAIQQEASAQIERALDYGIQVTHIDTHMGSVVHPKFLDAYVQVASQHHIPAFLLRAGEARLREELGLDHEVAGVLAKQLKELEFQGVPMLDDIRVMPLNEPENRPEQVMKVLEGLSAGITLLNIHPAKDTPELRAITPDWRGRVSDYRAFTSEKLKKNIQNSRIQVIGWRSLRSLIQYHKE